MTEPAGPAQATRACVALAVALVGAVVVAVGLRTAVRKMPPPATQAQADSARGAYGFGPRAAGRGRQAGGSARPAAGSGGGAVPEAPRLR